MTRQKDSAIQYIFTKDGFYPEYTNQQMDEKKPLELLYDMGRVENPALFFELRGIDMNKFIDVALENRVDNMLKNAQKPSDRIIDDGVDVNELFGVI